eukprot:m.44038 g.44038  ORF g.44038 m.44038 type:complete len:94 (+) comp10580_c0_seq1:1400-1681(+)
MDLLAFYLLLKKQKPNCLLNVIEHTYQSHKLFSYTFIHKYTYIHTVGTKSVYLLASLPVVVSASCSSNCANASLFTCVNSSSSTWSTPMTSGT